MGFWAEIRIALLAFRLALIIRSYAAAMQTELWTRITLRWAEELGTSFMPASGSSDTGQVCTFHNWLNI